MKVHDTRSHHHPHQHQHQQPSDQDTKTIMTRKQKAASHEGHQSPTKKPKNEAEDHDRVKNGKSQDLSKEFEEYCNAVREHLSIAQMREILELNDQDPSGSEGVVITKCQDLLFFGPLERCPLCGGNLEFNGKIYGCTGFYSEWSSCTFKSKNPPRKQDPTRLPDSVLNSSISDMLKKYQDSSRRPSRDSASPLKPLAGMVIALSGRLSRTHQEWRKLIEQNGGRVSNSVLGVSCLVATSAERDRGGSSKHAEAVERGIRVVREEWLVDCIEKQEPQPLEAYDIMTDIAVDGKGIPWDKQDPSDQALDALTAELKLYGKRGVHKDTKLLDQGAAILEKDGILYNCAFFLCDLGRGINEFCIMQLITVEDGNLHMYYKKGKVGDDPNAEERLEEWDSVDSAIKEFVNLFEEITGNEFEPWEREKKFEKKRLSFFPIDMDDGVDVRHGGLGLRQLGAASLHSSLEPKVANFMKSLCSQEIYRYALMEMDMDSPDLPVGMLSDIHLKRGEEALVQFVEAVKSAEGAKGPGRNEEAVWSDHSQRWFTLMPSTRPFVFKDYKSLADNAAAGYETIRDINVASRIIGDMSGATLDDPLSDRYKKLGCNISALDKDSDDYKMIIKYLETTYEPVKVADIEYGVRVEDIFAVESSASPSLEDMKKLPNKVLLWCGKLLVVKTRALQFPIKDIKYVEASAERVLTSGVFPSCSGLHAEAARYGFTAVDRAEGFLVLAVASLGEQIMEFKTPPEDTKSLEEKKVGVKGLGRKKTDEAEHFTWKDGIKVPCGKLVASEHKDSVLEYNEYAVYDPKMTSIRFLVAVKYEEQNAEVDEAEP
ncbi:Protein ADP-ribosyltransferase PARP3 [Linum grandiflorum]